MAMPVEQYFPAKSRRLIARQLTFEELGQQEGLIAHPHRSRICRKQIAKCHHNCDSDIHADEYFFEIGISIPQCDTDINDDDSDETGAVQICDTKIYFHEPCFETRNHRS